MTGRPRVLVTRAADSADALCSALRERGCEPVRMPLLSFAPGPDADAVATTIDTLPGDAWVAVTSPRASAALSAAGGTRGRGLLHVGSDLPNAANVAEELVRRGATTVLWLCGDRALPTLADRLAEASVELRRLVVYRTVVRVPPGDERNTALADLAAATFTSPSTVDALCGCADAAWLATARASLRCAALGGTTAKALMDAGFSRVEVSAAPTTEALADAACGL